MRPGAPGLTRRAASLALAAAAWAHPEVLKRVFSELQAKARRSDAIVPVLRQELAERPRMADAFRAEALIPQALKAVDLAIWKP